MEQAFTVMVSSHSMELGVFTEYGVPRLCGVVAAIPETSSSIWPEEAVELGDTGTARALLGSGWSRLHYPFLVLNVKIPWMEES